MIRFKIFPTESIKFPNGSHSDLKDSFQTAGRKIGHSVGGGVDFVPRRSSSSSYLKKSRVLRHLSNAQSGSNQHNQEHCQHFQAHSSISAVRWDDVNRTQRGIQQPTYPVECVCSAKRHRALIRYGRMDIWLVEASWSILE